MEDGKNMKKPGYKILIRKVSAPDFYRAEVRAEISDAFEYRHGYVAATCPKKSLCLADARAFVRWKDGRVVRIEER